MSPDFLLGSAISTLVCLIVAIAARWQLEQDVHWLDIAHRQRLAMIDEIQRAAGGSMDVFESMCNALEEVELAEHAKRMRKGEVVSQIYPSILWGVAKAVEGVER